MAGLILRDDRAPAGQLRQYVEPAYGHAESEPAPQAPTVEPKTAQGLRPVAWWLWGGYLALIVAAESAVSLGSPHLGLALHLTTLFTLLVHGSFGPSQQRPLLVSLTFAPLVRVVSLSLPLAGLPMLYWYVLTSVPLFVAVVPTVRVLGLTRAQLGLRIGNLPLQLAIGLVGLPLGLVEHLILRPAPLLPELTWLSGLLAALVLVVCTGFLEELIFRGVLQTTVGRVLGRSGLFYVSAIFAALHIGYLSALDVVFVFGVGLAFAWLVARTGSLLGVTLAHGLTNLALFILVPLAMAQLSFAAPSGLEAGDQPAADSDLVEAIPFLEADPPAAVPSPTPPPAAPPVLHPAPSASDLPSPRPYEPPVESAFGPPKPLEEPVQTAADGEAETGGGPEQGPDEDGWEPYVVQRGDTLVAIARRRRTSIEALAERNGIRNPSLIYAEQGMLVPEAHSDR
jgi:membrane protease YdiL (CAAX protease family)